MGRNKVDNPRVNRIQVRFSDDEMKLIRKYAKDKTGKNVLGTLIRNIVLDKIKAHH